MVCGCLIAGQAEDTRNSELGMSWPLGSQPQRFILAQRAAVAWVHPDGDRHQQRKVEASGESYLNITVRCPQLLNAVAVITALPFPDTGLVGSGGAEGRGCRSGLQRGRCPSSPRETAGRALERRPTPA